LLPALVDQRLRRLYVIASDPAVWEQHPSKDRTEESVFRRWFEEALASGGALVAVDPATDEVIGGSRFVLHRPDEVEIAWTFLARSRWGGTWNSELKRLMLEHSFRKVQRVRFTIHSDNVRSQRAVRRLGAEQVGKAPDVHGRGGTSSSGCQEVRSIPAPKALANRAEAMPFWPKRQSRHSSMRPDRR
jgi:RimJ/RimL family protein N-acetyltransferase